MSKTNVILSLKEYDELVKATEKIAAVERLFKATQYVTAQDIAAILGIEREDPYEIK